MKKNVTRVFSGELEGIGARIVEIEADVNIGLHSFNIVGLADRALNEAKERVNSALKNCGVKPPNRENRKITINLAPAGMKKTGSQYDLGIALGYLFATKQIAAAPSHDTIFLGELALDGRLRPVNGALGIAERGVREGFTRIIVPKENANEAAAIGGIGVVAAETLTEVIGLLEGRETQECVVYKERAADDPDVLDLSEIRGQENAKRALMIAAAGRHNLLLVGPPGVGKSMLARALKGMMPQLTRKEAVEVTKIWSAAGLSNGELMKEPPFRAPHRTISPIALVGGGSDPRPGEISLAHRGVLFLDELPEFPRSALEALREPLEAGEFHVTRTKRDAVFPARFTFVAAMNPCPCGYYGDAGRECKCSAYEIIKYQKKISGPLLDRIDLQVKIGRVEMNAQGGKSEDARQRILMAREIQQKRFGQKAKPGTGGKCNADMSPKEVRLLVKMDVPARGLLDSLEKTHLSPRAYHRILKTARTIADLEGNSEVSADNLAEAFGYRLKEIW